MNVALRERDGDAALIEGLVNFLLAPFHVTYARRLQDILFHHDIHAAVCEVAKTHLDTIGRLYHVTAIGILFFHHFQSFHKSLAHLLEIGTVCYSHMDRGEFITVVTGKVGEVLAEQ